jgi:hypothetical protein
MKGKILSVMWLTALCLSSFARANTTRYANGTSGSDSNNCASPTTACKTIGHAILLSVSGDSINVAVGTYKENLTISINLTVTGSGARTTVIDGGAVGTVLTVSSGAQVTISNFTIRNGNAEWGGGVFNSGVLTLNRSAVVNNASTGKLFRGAEGGGIWNNGRVLITGSIVSGNTARGSAGGIGGGMANFSTAIVSNSTFSGNSTAGGGGGIYNARTLIISNTTVSGNASGFGGGVYSAVGSATFQNSIIASNSSANCGGTMISNGYNLSGDSSCAFDGPGDFNDTDPQLGPLQNNGGPTNTMALPSGSPAIDAGNPGGCTDGEGHLLKTDQRGDPRPDNQDIGGCDMGAFERQTD